MVSAIFSLYLCRFLLSVLALSSRFDGSWLNDLHILTPRFQYSLCRVVLMVIISRRPRLGEYAFSTRSVESF